MKLQCDSKYPINLNVSSYHCYNPGHNILRLFDILPNFLFTTSEKNGDY